MDKTTEIYRYGNYITKVVGKDALKQWIIDNCSYNNAVGEIPPGTPFAECLAIARDRGFTFNTTVSDAITQKEVGRLSNILVYARFPGVAQDLAKTRKVGGGIVCSCPHCNSQGSLLIVDQTYRCFSCGTMGNVVSFVMDTLEMDYDTALDYLESKYTK